MAGISGYGNSVGVPTVGGELTFNPCYAQNPLVNVLCMGVLPIDRLVLGKASGVGNLAVLLGSSTGRDGIGGVSVLASAGFGGGDAGRGRGGPSGPASRSATPTRRSASSRRASSCSTPAWWWGSRTSVAPGSCARPARRRPRVGWGWTSTFGRAPARAGHGPLRGDDLREPGADAGHRHARRPGPRGGGLPPVGGTFGGGRPGHRAARAKPGTCASSTASTARCWATCRPWPSVRTPRSTTGRWPGPATTTARRPTTPARWRHRTTVVADIMAMLSDPSWVYRQYDHQLFLNTVDGPGRRRRRAPAGRSRPAAFRQGPGAHHRLQPDLVLDRSQGRHRGRRWPKGPQRGLCRGPPDGRRQLPQLRQPRASRGDVAAVGVHRRDDRSLPRRWACRSSGEM